MVVTISIELAMDHKPSHRELASVLISDLYQKVISQRDIGKGMEKLDILLFSKFYIRTIFLKP
jgi:programmed cell death protein 4